MCLVDVWKATSGFECDPSQNDEDLKVSFLTLTTWKFIQEYEKTAPELEGEWISSVSKWL